MNKSIDELGSENVLATKSLDENKQTESASENEESDTVSEQSSSSSSETTNTQNSLSNTSKSTNSKRKSNSTSTKSPSTVTQFSVQRSDVDGLRMKISAIRPTTTAATTTATITTNLTNPISCTKQPNQQTIATTTKTPTAAVTAEVSYLESNSESGAKTKMQSKNMHYNNNCLTKPLTVKLSNIKLQRKNVQSAKVGASDSLELRHTGATVAQIESRSGGAGVTGKTLPAIVEQNNGNTTKTVIVGDVTVEENAVISSEISPSLSTNIGNEITVAQHVTLPMTLPLTQPALLSDGTAESGCSEATTSAERTLARRVRVKRKKAQSKLVQDQKKSTISAAAVFKSAQTQQLHNLMTYTSESEDETLQQQQQQQKQQKRAPRILLTAINSNNATPTCDTSIKPLALASTISAIAAGTSATFSHGSDNSDGELKLDDVVNAVIKRVESDGDDTPTGPEIQRKARVKRLPQYQSTLLQDFMEKTQMLGSSSSSSAAAILEQQCANLVETMENVGVPIRNKSVTDLLANTLNTKAPTDNAVSSGIIAASIVKKKRGRPKKSIATTATSTTKAQDTDKMCYAPTSVIMSTASATHITTAASSIASNINESADSGVISTTSTTATQSSTSPSPKLTNSISSGVHGSTAARLTTTTAAATTPPSQKRRQRTVEANEECMRRQPSISPSKSQTQDGSGSCSASSPKPKIDIAYLDKRMYAATERVLYPPPRNKRRQSMSTASVNLVVSAPSNKNDGKTLTTVSASGSSGVPVRNTTPVTVAAKALSKEELQLDPVWRKIDVNKKFRRPSLSGYKSDGGGGNTTICSKILAAKSGYVSDYGSYHARATRDHSGYKSDASGKSRYSMKSCISRRSRAKSCGYRSDCKDVGAKEGGVSIKSSKYRRKRRTAALLRAPSKSVGNLAAASLNDAEKDILQLAGLSLGQSSEESNEYVCKPNLESLPTTSASKKYGEINRFIATGEYFGRGSNINISTGLTSAAGGGGGAVFPSNIHDPADGGSGSHDDYGFSCKLLLQRKHSMTSGGGNGGGGTGCVGAPTAHETLLTSHPHLTRKIKSRRSSIASYCSSFYSSTSKVRKRHRRKSFLRFPLSGKSGTIIDSKLLTEIDILTNTFSARCRIQNGTAGGEKPSGSGSKEKVLLESGAVVGKVQGGNAFNTTTSSCGAKREQRDKRSLKKRKMSENPDYAFMSGVGGGGVNSNIAGFAGVNMLSGGSGSTKRRHKKANSSSSPDDHKLPLKKRHYLLTPGDKSTEAAAAAAVAAKLFGSTAVEAWAAAVASTKLAAGAAGKMSHNQQQFGSICSSSATLSNAGSTKPAKAALTPKKRQFTQQDDASIVGSCSTRAEGIASNTPKCSNSSPLRIAIDSTTTLSHKLLDISPISLTGSTTTKQIDVHRKRSRLEVLVSKIVATSSNSNSQNQSGLGPDDNINLPSTVMSKQKPHHHNQQQHQHAADTPPPGVFEPSVALEIQIPPIARLNDGTASGMNSGGSAPIVAKSEVNSPLMLQEMTPPSVTTTATTKTECGGVTSRVVETLLNKTGAANMLLKRKRKKINRTGFPNVRRRKKSKITDQLLLDIVEDEEVERVSPMRRRARTFAKQTPQQSVATLSSGNGENTTEAHALTTPPQAPITTTPEKQLPCDRVPISGEASDSFLERANRTPRLSVVALERLRGTPTPTTAATAPKPQVENTAVVASATQSPPAEVIEAHKENSFVTRKGRVGRKPKAFIVTTPVKTASVTTQNETENAMPAARKCRKNTITECTVAAVATSMPTTPKSSKRVRATGAPVAIEPAKVITSERAQPLGSTNNALLPRARGRRPKLSAAALLTNDLSNTATLITPPEQIKGDIKTTAIPQTNSKVTASSPHAAKHSRRVIATTPSNSMKSLDRPASFSKSTVHKIITAKSLEAKVKLPAGIDPNTNFSCKIRLKRPSTKKTAALANALRTQSMDSNGDGSSIKGISQSTPEEIALESAAKDANIDYPEQDVLPRSETPCIDSEAATSDTSDEKCSTSTSGTSVSSTSVAAAAARKVARLKKNYLPAGLFSEYFKQAQQMSVLGKRTSLEKKETIQTLSSAAAPISPATEVDATILENANDTPVTAVLPPPPYCEQYFRRTQIDFQLPYDIWWAYTNSKLPTRITVPSWNYRKIRTNIYADNVRPNTANLDHPTCNCKPDQGCGDNCLNRMVYTECSPSTCPAREKCRNQKIQRHEVAPGVERFMTTDKGWGVRTKLAIMKGTYILEYVGEVVTDREFKDRMGTIYLNDIHHYCLNLDGGLLIDGHRMGSDGRFVNHSCQPNCEMQKWSVNGLSRMALFAKRNIEPGEELSYDYNFSLFNPSEGQPCRCNTPQCRGVIGGKSQRIKPLPVESKNSEPTPKETTRIGRSRKRQARKNTERVQSKDVVISHGQQLSEKEKKFVKQHGIFLVRNFEKIRRCKAKRKQNAREVKVNGSSIASPTTSTNNITSLTNIKSIVGGITTRRSSTPALLTGQLTAVRSPRSIKTRGLTHAVQDPEVEKMAKIAVILRDICMSLEILKDTKDKKQTLVAVALANSKSTGVGANISDHYIGSVVGKKRRKSVKTPIKSTTTTTAQESTTLIDWKTVQTNIEQGYYKLPSEFNADMQQVFEIAHQQAAKGSRQEAALHELITLYERKKRDAYARLLEIVGGDESILMGFIVDQTKLALEKHKVEANLGILKDSSVIDTSATIITPTSTEDIIRCICGLHKDEGLMIQCARCMVWQHTECTKADVNADNYLCERCEPRIVDREIPLDDYTEEGHRYYLTLLRGDLHVRQGDAVYVLRDIPVKDAAGNVVPKQKHTYETIGSIDYNECDIFRVERLWKNGEGKRFIFGHHFLRPHETFHEPSRRFYPNEVVRVPLYEVIPIELVIGRCWVLDKTTFCKGRPVECNDEAHCYICELRVDRTARFFSKAKVNYPTCTKTYAFRKFPEKLKICKSYAPHDIDPSLLKPKRPKSDGEIIPNVTNSTLAPILTAVTGTTSANPCTSSASAASKPQTIGGRRRRNSCFPGTVHTYTVIPPSQQTMKNKRTNLESVLNTMKLKWKNTQTTGTEQPVIDLSYLLLGRRQRKSQAAIAIANTSTTSMNTPTSST